MNLELGQTVQIQSYKHDKSLHRLWERAIVLNNDENTLIVGNRKTKVIESNGRVWYTREPAVCYFFKDYWFNVICMVRKDGIHYYCNISSPYLFDGEAIKYVDYDLDVKVFPNETYKVLDLEEYEYHMVKMSYPRKVKVIIEDQLRVLIDKIDNRKSPFNDDEVIKWYEKFKNMEGEDERS